MQQWYDKVEKQLIDAKEEYDNEFFDLKADQKRQLTIIHDLEDFIDELADEVIGSVRKIQTNFDNQWLPHYEVELDAPSQFVKYVGFNIIVCQDL